MALSTNKGGLDLSGFDEAVKSEKKIDLSGFDKAISKKKDAPVPDGDVSTNGLNQTQPGNGSSVSQSGNVTANNPKVNVRFNAKANPKPKTQIGVLSGQFGTAIGSSMIKTSTDLTPDDVEYITDELLIKAQGTKGYEADFFGTSLNGGVNKDYATKFIKEGASRITYKDGRPLSNKDIEVLNTRWIEKLGNQKTLKPHQVASTMNKLWMGQAKKENPSLYQQLNPPIPKQVQKGKELKWEETTKDAGYFDKELLGSLTESEKSTLGKFLIDNKEVKQKMDRFNYGSVPKELQKSVISQALSKSAEQAVGRLQIYKDQGDTDKMKKLGELQNQLTTIQAQQSILQKSINANEFDNSQLTPEQKDQLDMLKSQYQVLDNEYETTDNDFNSLKKEMQPLFDELKKLEDSMKSSPELVDLEAKLGPVYKQFEALAPLVQQGDTQAIIKHNQLVEYYKNDLEKYKELSAVNIAKANEYKRLWDDNKSKIDVYNERANALTALGVELNTKGKEFNTFISKNNPQQTSKIDQYKNSIEKYNALKKEAAPLYEQYKSLYNELGDATITDIAESVFKVNEYSDFEKRMVAEREPSMREQMLSVTQQPFSNLAVFDYAVMPFVAETSKFISQSVAGGIKVVGELGEMITLKPDDYYSFADWTADVVQYGFDGTGKYWTDEILPGLRKSDFVDPISGELVYSPASILVGSFEQMGQIAGAALGTYGSMGLGMARNAAIVTPMFMATYENNVDLAKQLGFEGAGATQAGILFSMIEGYSELIFPDIDFFQGAAKKAAFNMFLENFTKGGAKMATKRFLETVGKELGEEYVVELGKYLATMTTRFAKGSNQVYQIDPAQLLETSIFVFTSAGAGAAVQAKLTTSKNFNSAMMFKMAMDLETSIPMIEQYNTLGKIDNKKADALIRNLKIISALQGQLPEDISEPKRVVISGLYTQISALEQKMQDPNITEEIKDSYKESIKKIKGMITMVMIADDATFTKNYNDEIAKEGEAVAEEVSKQYPGLGTAYSYLGGEKMQLSETDQVRMGILDDIFKDSTAQRKADALEQRMNNAEEISMNEINDVLDGLYGQVEMIMNSYFDNEVGKQYAQALLDKIDKIKSYEFATNKETAVVTERKAVQTARTSLQETASVINLARAPRRTATITNEDGTTGTYSIEVGPDGAVTFEQQGAEPIQVGNVNDVNKTAKIVETVLNEQGLPQSVSFSVTDQNGKLHTITVEAKANLKPQQLLDLAINIRANELGTVDPTDFDTAYQEVTREVTTTKPTTDAVQIETAGQVPVQPETVRGETDQEGQPQAESQEVAQTDEVKVEPRQKQPTAQQVIEQAARERLNKVTQNVLASTAALGIDVRIIEDQAEFDRITGVEGKTNGLFDDQNGVVYVNPARMKLATRGNRVLFHESTHPVLNILYNTNRELYDTIFNGMTQAGNSGMKMWQDLLNFRERYIKEGYSEAQADNELMTETIGRIINGEIGLNDIPVGFRQALIDLLNKVAKLLGIKPIGPVTDAGKFRDFAASLKDAFEQGRDISTIVGAENVKQYQSPFVQEQLSLMGIDQNQFLEMTKQMATDVESMVVPGNITNGWIQTGKKGGEQVVKFTGEATLENIRQYAIDSYINRAYNLAQYDLSGIDVKGDFLKKLVGIDAKQKALFEKSFFNVARTEIQKIIDSSKLNKAEKDTKEDLDRKKRTKDALKQALKINDIGQLYDAIEAIGKDMDVISSSLITSLYQKRDFVYDETVKAKIDRWNDQKKRGVREADWVTKKISELVFAKRNNEAMANEADGIYENMKTKVKENLRFIYDLVNPAIRNLTKLWYDGANVIAQEFGSKYNLSLEQTAGIIASQSPQMPWFSNLHLAQTIMDIMMTKGNEVFTKQQYDYYVAAAKGYAKQRAYIPTVKGLIGKRLNELSDYDAGIFIRSYYDLNMSRKAPKRLPSGVIVSYETGDSSFSSYDTIEKGVSIFRDGSVENISANLGEANKVRNFYNNIVDPTNINSVTIDTHAMAVSLIMPFGASDTEIKFDSGSYAFYSDSYNELARELNLGARELQSITWEAIRAFFPDNIKTAKFKGEIADIWNRYSKGIITIDQARNEILNKGKDANKTEWSDSIQDWMDGKTGTDYFRPIDRKGDVPGTASSRDGQGVGGGVPTVAGADIREGRDVLGRKPSVGRKPKGQPSLMEGQEFESTINGETVVLKPVDVDVVDGFYSPLEQEVFDSKQDKMPAKKWLDRFKGREEAKWTGLNDWLESQDKAVSKQDILDYMKENRVLISEVVLETKNTAKERFGSGQQLELPGEKENYREVLVTLPKSEPFILSKTKSFDTLNYTKNTYGVNSSEYRSIKNIVQDELLDKGLIYPLIKQLFDQYESTPQDFKSSHFDEPNILVHLRMNERTDAEGNKVLFLEEIQSDWAQKGRKEGFEDLEKQKLSAQKNALINEYDNLDDLKGEKRTLNVIEKMNDILNNIRNINKKLGLREDDYRTIPVVGTGIPAAPFVMNTSDWVKLAMRVALKEAVKSGANRIAWTTGEQQNARYDLSKSISSITIDKTGENSYMVMARSKEDQRLIIDQSYRKEDLPNVIGKDLADSMVAEADKKGIYGGTVLREGDNLKIGGSGMKGFYDRIVPDVAKSVVKALTGKAVEVVETRIETSTPKISDLAEALSSPKNKIIGKETTTQQSIEVSPVVKAAVKRGLPQFSLMEADTGININDDVQPFTEQILSGQKKIETRNTPTLRPYVGRTVGIIKTSKNNKALLVGYVTIEKEKKYSNANEFDADYKKHLVANDSPFYIKDVKYGYTLKNPTRISPVEVNSFGIVFRSLKDIPLGDRQPLKAKKQFSLMDDPSDIIEQFGRNAKSFDDAQQALSNGDYVFLNSEMDGIPYIANDIQSLKANYDQVIIVKKEDYPIPAPSQQQVDDLNKTIKRALPKGQASLIETTVFANPAEMANKQWPLYQSMRQMGIDAFDNGARDVEAFLKYLGTIQWPDEISRNYHTISVWDDVIRIKQNKKPLINSERDYEKMVRNKSKSHAANVEEINKKKTSAFRQAFKSKTWFESRADLFDALAKQSGELWGVVSAYIHTIGGMTEKGIYQSDMFMEATYDGLSETENIPFLGKMYSERTMFDELLTVLGYIETNRKMNDKFDEFIDVEQQYRNETDPAKKEALKEVRDYLKDYLDRNKVLIGNGRTIPYSLKDFTRSNLDMASANSKINSLITTYPELFDKLSKRADHYFEAWKTLLRMRLDAGMLSQESFDEMEKYNYVPTKFIGYLLKDVSDETDVKLPESTKGQIERLRGGSEDQLIMAHDEALRFAAMSVARFIQKNNAVLALARAIDANPNNTMFYKPEVKSRDRFGNATDWVYDKKTRGLIKYYVDGKLEAIATETAVADAFNGKQEAINMPEGIGWMFMSTPFRMVTTNLNPAFGLAQIVLDLNQALLTSDAYATVLYGGPAILFRDFKLLTGKTLGWASKKMGLNFNLDSEWQELFNEAREYGALISFTKTETFDTSLERAAGMNSSLDKALNGNNAFSKAKRVIEDINTSMEYVTRLAIYRKVRNNLIDKYKKANNGASPKGQALDDIRTEAAATSMNTLNYNRGGSFIKPLNRAMAYLNVGFQVPYSIFQYAKKSPGMFTLKASELAVYGALGTVMLFNMLDDDDKDKFLEYYNRLSPYEKSNYWHYPNPFRDKKDPDTFLLRFKKPSFLLPLINSVEVIAMNKATNGKTQKPNEYLTTLPTDGYTPNLARDFYEAQPFKAGVVSSMPSLNAAMIGFGNFDLYRMQYVVPKGDVIANPLEGIEDPKVGQFYKYVSQNALVTDSKYFSDGTFSPKRMDASIKAMVGDYTRNPITSYPLWALGAFMDKVSTGYAEANKYVPEEPEKPFVGKLLEGAGLTQRFTTRIPPLKPVTKKKINEQQVKKNAMLDVVRMDLDLNVQKGEKPSKYDLRTKFDDIFKNDRGMFTVEEYETLLEKAFMYAQRGSKIKEVEDQYIWIKPFILTPSPEGKAIIWESETSDYTYDQKIDVLRWLVQNQLFVPGKDMLLDEDIVKDLKKFRK